MFTTAHSSAAGSIHYSHYEHYGHGGWSLTWAGTGNWCWHFQTWSHMWLHWLSPQQNWFSPRRGIEPRSPAWQAGILATILSRNWWKKPDLANSSSDILCSTSWPMHPKPLRQRQYTILMSRKGRFNLGSQLTAWRVMVHTWFQ